MNLPTNAATGSGTTAGIFLADGIGCTKNCPASGEHPKTAGFSTKKAELPLFLPFIFHLAKMDWHRDCFITLTETVYQKSRRIAAGLCEGGIS